MVTSEMLLNMPNLVKPSSSQSMMSMPKPSVRNGKMEASAV